jgi:hypothetical protein
LADLSAAKSDIRDSVVEGTHTKQTHGWVRYKAYLQSIGIKDDVYLDSFTSSQKLQILSAFAQAIWQGRFGTKCSSNTKSDSVRALDSVAQDFRLADRKEPKLNPDQRFAFILQHQLWGYKALDKGEKPQAAVCQDQFSENLWNSLSLLLIRLCVNYSLVFSSLQWDPANISKFKVIIKPNY